MKYLISFDVDSFHLQQENSEFRNFMNKHNLVCDNVLPEIGILIVTSEEDLVAKWKSTAFKKECGVFKIVSIEKEITMEIIATPDVSGKDFSPSGIAHLKQTD